MFTDMQWYAIDAIELALVFGPVLLLGVPAILMLFKHPVELGLERQDDTSMGELQQQHFGSIDTALGPLGFRPVLNFSAAALPGLNFTRVYWHDAEPTLALASAVYQSDGATHASADWLEFSTRFADQGTLLTRNSQNTVLLDDLPDTVTVECRGLRDAARLKRRHDARLAQLRQREPVQVEAEAFLELYAGDNRRYLAHQVKRGLLRRQGDSYRATSRLAWRGVRTFFNPLADNFTPPRLLLGLLVGWLAPWAVLLTGTDMLGWQGEDPRLLVLVALVLLLSNLGIGLVWGAKTLIWGFLLGSLAARFALPAALYEAWSPWLLLVLFAVAAAPAEWVANRREKSRARFET